MKAFGGLLLFVCVLGLSVFGLAYLDANNRYQNDIHSYWSLSDKSSTIPQKSQYLDLYVSALSRQDLEGSNSAWIYQTLDTSFDQNFHALQSLQIRYHEILKMDPTSFAYQTAIQQITAQEQGEAGAMLGVFESCWYKVNHPALWWGAAVILGLLFIGFVGGATLVYGIDNDY